MSDDFYDDPEDQNYIYKKVIRYDYSSDDEIDILSECECYLRCRKCVGYTRLRECPYCGHSHLWLRNWCHIETCVCGRRINSYAWRCTKCSEKNPWLEDNFVYRVLRPKEGNCFIATACFGNYGSPEVIVLRQFRDQIIMRTKLGKTFIRLYYIASLPIAKYLVHHHKTRKFMRLLLSKVVLRYAQNILHK